MDKKIINDLHKFLTNRKIKIKYTNLISQLQKEIPTTTNLLFFFPYHLT